MVRLFQGLMLTTTKSSNDIQLAVLLEGLLYSAPTHCFTRLTCRLADLLTTPLTSSRNASDRLMEIINYLAELDCASSLLPADARLPSLRGVSE